MVEIDHAAALAEAKLFATNSTWPGNLARAYLDLAARQVLTGTAEAIWESLRSMTDEQRTGVLSDLSEHFCKYCGTVYLPCSCWNDE